MRLLIHAANLKVGGGLAVAVSLLEAWQQVADDTIAVLASPEVASQVSAVPGMRVEVVDPAPTASLGNLLAFRRRASRLEAAFAPDAVLTVFGPALWRPAAPHLCGFANGLFLWPNPAAMSRWALAKAALRCWQALRSLYSDADALWVETQRAREALLQRLPGAVPVAVVPNALHPVFTPYRSGARTIAPPPAAGPFRLFTPAAGYPHKNFGLIRDLLPLIDPDECTFHTTLTDADLERYFGTWKRHPALVNAGPVKTSDLPAHYEAAHAVFTPSLLEIASAAWQEAAVMQRPVISADIPAARDQCGDGALYVTPNSPGEALTAIRRLQSDPALRQSLVANGLQQLRNVPTAIDRVHALRQLLLDLRHQKRHP